ncbi:uncharacterized protein LOC124178232 [Neodiprion fabricii]|uniref:uncharacterized protein LOC124178232 n=1 Tax=Neodiprion fabricii TaxID=2872261 RepID=UPI001ED8E7EF|nr:uncharacterized protein LOC124178232 [Neodiprion fabricii]
MVNYSVVEFEDGLHLVPTLWLNKDKTSCCWPSHFRNQYDVNKAVIRSIIPNDGGKDWEYFNVKRIFSTADSYEKGMEKLCLAEETSNMEETASSNDEAEAIQAKKRRREKAKKHFSSSDSEICEEQRQSKLQPFPPVPQFYESRSKTGSTERKHHANHGSSSSQKDNRASTELERSITGLGVPPLRRGYEISSSEGRHDSNRGTLSLQKENRAFNELERSFTELNDSLTKSANHGTNQRKSSQPLPPSHTSKTKIPEDDVTELTTHKGLHKTRDDPNDVFTTEGFMKLMLSKLNKLLHYVKELDEKLVVSDERSHNLHLAEFDSEDEEDLGLPLRDVAELTRFDEKLKNATFCAKMIQWLKRFGGTDANASTSKMLGKLMSNPLAQQYSWAGFKGKKIFKELRLVRLVMKTVRVRVPGASDVIFAEIISKWLAQAKLRNIRDVAKTTKQNKSAATKAVNRTKEAANGENRLKETASAENRTKVAATAENRTEEAVSSEEDTATNSESLSGP